MLAVVAAIVLLGPVGQGRPPAVLGAHRRETVAADDIAIAIKPWVRVFQTPGGARVQLWLRNPGPDGDPQVLSVIRGDRKWLQVRLPVRPNGSTGWVPAADFQVTRTAYRLTIQLRTTKLSLYRGRKLIFTTRIAVGTSRTPTPRGRFYITAVLTSPDPSGIYGPYAFGLSAHSAILRHFAGGDGRVGIHGTNQPGLLGSRVSHGCIRVSNSAIRRLVKILPPGTPVLIK